MQLGTIKWFDAQRRYGFIRPENGGDDVFLPLRIVQRSTLIEAVAGLRVAFETEPDPSGKGLRATRIEAAD